MRVKLHEMIRSLRGGPQTLFSRTMSLKGSSDTFGRNKEKWQQQRKMSMKRMEDEDMLLSKTGVEALVVTLTFVVGMMQIFYVWGTLN